MILWTFVAFVISVLLLPIGFILAAWGLEDESDGTSLAGAVAIFLGWVGVSVTIVALVIELVVYAVDKLAA